MAAQASFVASLGKKKERLDVVATKALENLSKSEVTRLITSGNVTVNGQVVTKALFKLKNGDEVKVTLAATNDKKEIIAEAIPLKVVYEDDHLMVVDKEAGMVVHPSSDAGAHYSGTLVNALLHHCGPSNLSTHNDPEGIRPGIVHRIDKDTSGLLVVAKTNQAHERLAAQLEGHNIDRIYNAIVYGVVKDDRGTIDSPIFRHPVHRKKRATATAGGKVGADARPAVTHFEVVERFLPCSGSSRGGYTLIRARLETGRTHQVRVHMASIHHPLVCDPEYGPGMPTNDPDLMKVVNTLPNTGQMLHAASLTFKHPETSEEVHVTAPLPWKMEALLEALRPKGWTCTVCTLVNTKLMAPVCEACGTMRAESPVAAAPSCKAVPPPPSESPKSVSTLPRRAVDIGAEIEGRSDSGAMDVLDTTAWMSVLRFLRPTDLCQVSMVCVDLWRLSGDFTFWRSLCVQDFKSHNLEKEWNLDCYDPSEQQKNYKGMYGALSMKTHECIANGKVVSMRKTLLPGWQDRYSFGFEMQIATAVSGFLPPSLMVVRAANLVAPGFQRVVDALQPKFREVPALRHHTEWIGVPAVSPMVECTFKWPSFFTSTGHDLSDTDMERVRVLDANGDVIAAWPQL